MIDVIRGLQAELTELRDLAAVTPQDDPFSGGLLGERIQATEARLNTIQDSPPLKPETEILFSGGPVIGSQGIDAKFASKVLDSFQDMVTNEFAASHGLLRRTGRRRGESGGTALPYIFAPRFSGASARTTLGG